MNIRILLESLASEIAFAEVGIPSERGAPPAGFTGGRGQLLVACDKNGLSGRLAAYALRLADSIWCDIVVAVFSKGVVRRAMPRESSRTADTRAARVFRGSTRSAASWPVSVGSLTLHGDFFAGVRDICLRNRRVDLVLLSCREAPPVWFQLEIPFFLFA